jgi:hypothetical protein
MRNMENKVDHLLKTTDDLIDSYHIVRDDIEELKKSKKMHFKIIVLLVSIVTIINIILLLTI